ncbi:MAG: hypothetical protein IJN38_03370 [Clostridia bacterium]|nr:hypothetical protein [Clostridia bacterium]
MLRKSKIIISIITVLVFLFNILFAMTNAIDSSDSSNKISKELNAKMAKLADDDLISVIVWFDDIDTDSVNTKAEKNLGIHKQI